MNYIYNKTIREHGDEADDSLLFPNGRDPDAEDEEGPLGIKEY